MKPVIRSIEDDTGYHCVDFALGADGAYTFKVFRKDPEDEGKWTLVSDYSNTAYATEQLALAAAGEKIPWVKETEIEMLAKKG